MRHFKAIFLMLFTTTILSSCGAFIDKDYINAVAQQEREKRIMSRLYPIQYCLTIDGVNGQWNELHEDITGTLGSFYIHDKDIHPSDYKMKVSINDFPNSLPTEVKTYTGTVEYYVTNNNITLKSALTKGGFLDGPKNTDRFMRYHDTDVNWKKITVKDCMIRVFPFSYDDYSQCYGIALEDENMILWLNIAPSIGERYGGNGYHIQLPE